nr:neural proliferation differentiation and control protein 1 [Pelodiscus sinensis]|eukprot:XP_025040783.1 neural proliferation differentiation and control protein 1 [Pelodiscus sinensis]
MNGTAQGLICHSAQIAGLTLLTGRASLVIQARDSWWGRVESCPRSLDCALQRREFCPAGSHACGPCLQQFVEDGHGHCVQRKWSSAGKCVWATGRPAGSA